MMERVEFNLRTRYSQKIYSSSLCLRFRIKRYHSNQGRARNVQRSTTPNKKNLLTFYKAISASRIVFVNMPSDNEVYKDQWRLFLLSSERKATDNRNHKVCAKKSFMKIYQLGSTSRKPAIVCNSGLISKSQVNV